MSALNNSEQDWTWLWLMVLFKMFSHINSDIVLSK
jgi:hypothetical protein